MADLDYAKYISELVARARKAAAIAENFTQEQVDELCEAIAWNCVQSPFKEDCARLLVEESRMGVFENKVTKIENKVRGVWRDMKGQKSVGLVEDNKELGIKKYAKPRGVIVAVMPCTNGEATPMCKALFAIKSRNAIIFSAHPRARKTAVFVADLIHKVLKKYGAPEDLVIAIDPEYVSVEASAELMKQCDFLMATGGTPMVRSAYSSGTPAIGVGTGNVVSIIDGTTDLNKVAEMIVASKANDNATSCSTENNIVVLESCYDEFVKAMAAHGAVLFKEGSEEREKIIHTLWPNTPADHVLNRDIVAKSAKEIAAYAGVSVPENTKVIMCEENGGFGNAYPLTGEKLSPVSGVRKVKTFEAALDACDAILHYQGLGHSCGIHSSVEEHIEAVSLRMKVCKVVVNAPQSLTNSGSWTSGYPMSLTLGCGTWGHNSISWNATWKDLLNYTFVSYPIPNTKPTDEELFDGRTFEV